MKKLLLATLAMLAIACSSDNNDPENNPEPVEDCIYVGNINLMSQADVDAFAAHHYCEIKGDLNIGSIDAVATNITNIGGLESLKSISGSLIIENNPQLINLHGLNSLVQINNNLFIHQNSALTNLEGIGPVKKMMSLDISLNISLQNLKGLENVESVSDFGVSDNDVLTSLEGVENLTLIDGSLGISGKSLTSLEALHSLSEVENIYISTTSLINLKGLEGVSGVKELYIRFNNSLTTLEGLQGINTFTSLTIVQNPTLASISHLSGLTLHQPDEFTNNNIRIDFNFMLPSLDGLQNITGFTGDIYLQKNIILKDFCAIRDIVTYGGNTISLYIAGNLYDPLKYQIIAGNCSQ